MNGPTAASNRPQMSLPTGAIWAKMRIVVAGLLTKPHRATAGLKPGDLRSEQCGGRETRAQLTETDS